MKEINKNSSKEVIKAWQKFVGGRADGVMGEKSAKATRFWQAENGLRADGIVGEMTLKLAQAVGFVMPVTTATEILIEKVISEPSPSSLDIFNGTRIDKINQAKLAKVSPTMQTRGELFLEAATKDGVILQIVQGLRTFGEQDALYAQGRTKPGKRVTNARGGQSLHNYGLALDFAPVVGCVVSWDEKLYRSFGKWADHAGLEWGGNWTKFLDLPHCQDDEGMSLAEIQNLYRRGGLAAVWAKVR